MRLIFVLFLFFTNGFAINEICNTIQLKTLFNSKENLELLQKNNYPKSCKIMPLGRVLTVRCECIENDTEAQDKFYEYKEKYQEALLIKVPKKVLQIPAKPVEPKPIKAAPKKSTLSSDELCYTVQLVSKYDTEESRDYFKNTLYPDGCENMQIGSYLTVRCQCLKSREKAQELLPSLKKEYPQAMVLLTAKSRFKNQNEDENKPIATVIKKVKDIFAKPIEILSVSTVTSTPAPAVATTFNKPQKAQPKASKSLASSGNCYSVQLVSKYDTKENREEFEKSHYPDSCKMMKIGNYLTQRCECLDKKSSALEKLPSYKKDYPQAMVLKTARYRFDEPEEKKVQKPVVIIPTPAPPPPPPPPVVEVVKPLILETEVIEPMQELKVESQEPIVAKIEEEKIEPEIEEKPVVKKKEKKKKSKKKKKKKSKKKKNEKYVKRYEQQYFYDRYLNKLESRRGIGPLDYRYSFGGRAEYDVGYVNEADDEYSNGHFRRARLSHEGNFLKEKLFYKIAYDFVDTDPFKDVYIGYKGKIKPLGLGYRIKAGNLKVPFSLERYGSSKNITFMEKAFNSELSLGRKVGLELLFSKKIEDAHRVNLFTSLFSNSIGERSDNEVNTNGFSLRGTYLHKFGKNHLLSFGLGYIQEDVVGENIKFSEAAETEFMREKYVSEKVKDVDFVKRKNVELLYIYNALSFQAEYTQVFLDALKDGYYYDAYYAQASYFVYGQGRSYKANNSSISKPKLAKYGGVELAFRYSYLNLNADGVDGVDPQNGGTQSDYNFGLNYYINNEFKLMFNYIVAKPKDTENYSGLLQVAQARLQFAF